YFNGVIDEARIYNRSLSEDEVRAHYEDTRQAYGFSIVPAVYYFRGDIVTVLDARDWYYRYVHLDSVEPAIQVGDRVSTGAPIGTLGKRGTSGGWAHLHFEVKSVQPSGEWGTQEAYAFIHEAYRRQRDLPLMAVAQPRLFAWTGRPVRLDGSRSWSASGEIARYDWTFTDGSTASGVEADRVYDRPGTYSEILRVADNEGRIAYDFARVTVLDSDVEEHWRSRLLDPHAPMDELLGMLPVRLHPAYHPTLGLRPGDPVTFLVRAFHTTEGSETWDFGDGTAPVTVRSDGNVDRYAPDGYARTGHRYDTPGDYLVRVERTDDRGVTGIAHLHVPVGVR
ncbi:MAG: PKD domain-containing protein, partial [Candidatus Latescibacteria bacterium]|nr:PKD domain-containing protein [Candidatus Latescibacterota bacterium]